MLPSLNNSVSRRLATEPASTLLPGRGHLPALDAVRGLAILMVTAYRFSSGPSDGGMLDGLCSHGLRMGQYGVDLFFVLSGFLITGILWDSKESPHYFRNFYLRRALRILPLYYASLLVGLFLLPRLLAGTTSNFASPPSDSIWLWLHVSNLTMAWKQEWLFEGYNHFWSLAIEEHFYLVWPLIIWKCNQRQAERACVACIALAVVVRLALIVGGWNSPSIELFTLCRIDGLAAGAWLALLLRRQDPIRWRLASSIACIGVGGLFTILGLTARKWLGPGLAAEMVVSTVYTWLAVGSFGLVLSGLFASRPESKVNPWNSRWLAVAGKYSYGWYVFQGMIAHDLLALGIVAGITGLCGSSLAGRFVQIMVGGGISLAMAVLSWHLFESRILSWKDRLAPRD